ncbi:tape measure protein [Paracoccus sp. SM22M-07]|uniref:tape measure protein n=1 Tax=Paracoccus sp. SM22M-07 TaxID=1520813 RepID=UPI000931BF99|nr:tape measure protein [Paracoccus sp. SM22M-07]
MSADERLMVMLEARITDFERKMRQAEQRGTKTYQGLERGSRSATRQMERDMVRSTSRINQALASTTGAIGSFGKALGIGLSAAAAAQLVRRYSQIADAATQMQNALRVAGLDGAELSRVYERLFQSAQRNSAPIGSLVDLYSKLALTQNELGVTSDELISFTDGIAVALKVAGTDATAASGSLLQLSQALGGGVVRAEEFNSILEGTPTIAQAVARGLKEAGGSVAELRKLVVDGEVSSTAFFRAFEVGSVQLREQAETSQTTVGQAMTRIGNSLVTVIGEFDKTSGASSGLARTIGDLADGLDSFDAAAFVGKIQRIVEAFGNAEAAAAGWIRQMADAQVFADLIEMMGIAEDGQFLSPEVREAEGKISALEKEVGTLQAQIENNTALGFDNTEAIARLREVRAELDAVRATAANLPRYVEGLRPDGTAVINNTETGTPITEYTRPPMPVPTEPVSIADHPPGGTPSTGGGGGRARRGGGGSKAKPKQDDFAKEVEDTRARIAALEAEAVVLTAVAASGREYGDALEFAQKKAELLTAAQEAGKEITPALEAEIDKLAEAYMTAGLNAESAAQKMEQIKEQSERGHRALEDMFGSVIDGSTSAKDAVAQLLLEIAKVQMMNAVFSLPGIGGVAGGLGGLLTPKIPGFATGGDHKGGYRIVGEKGPELEATGPARYFNANQTQQMLSGSQGGGQQEVAVHVTVGVDQKNGNLTAFVDKRANDAASKATAAQERITQDKIYLAVGSRRRGGR